MLILPDKNNNGLLTLVGTTYKLLGIAGRGGSSIVYKARKEGESEDYCMIKEFFPYDLVTSREADGSVHFSPDMADTVARRMSRALRETEIVNELRHGNENNNPWFLQYNEPIPANNTMYTVIATEAGEMLSEKISGGFFKNKSFSDICDCVLMILNALEPIHSKGFLHLDVSPDNIHFSDLNIMRMIDYNSAFSISGNSCEIIPSFKKGYSAPELKKFSDTKPPELSFATDLFSVAAIFFELLKGRPPEENDWLRRSGWYLNNEEGILKGASELLIKKTNAFLRNNLSSSPEIRLQNVMQMREEIERLKELTRVIQLVNSPKDPNKLFVCRKSEIEAIGELLKNDNYVILEGIGGIGKTELAKKYAKDNRDKYDVIQFVTFGGSLMSTVALSLAFHNFDRAKTAEYELKYGIDAVKYMYLDKMSCLKSKSIGKPSLIIVDNYNVAGDDNFVEFVSGEYKVIFTSRIKHDGSVLEVTEIKDENEQMELFYKYYGPGKISTEKELVVRDLLRLVFGHTMTIMLIAITMKESRKTPEEMLELLQTGLDPELRTKISIDKEDISAEVREQAMYRHITKLFDMTQIRKNRKYSFIMANMAIVPHTGVDIKSFYKWALSNRYKNSKYKDEDYTDLNRLIERRWIQYDEQTQRISLHPVISDVADCELKPDSAKCGALLNGLIEYGKGCTDQTHIERSSGAELLELACRRIIDETELTSDLYRTCALINDRLAQYILAAKKMKEALKIKHKIYGEEHPRTAALLNDTGLVYNHMNKYDDALDFYNRALSVYCKVYGENHSYTATLFYNIGLLYIKLGKYNKALEYTEKALAIRKSIHGENHLDVATSYMNIGTVYGNLNIYDKAMEYNEKAWMITEKINDGKHSSYASTGYNNMGVIFTRKGEYEKALENFNKALINDKIIVGEEHPSIAITYYNIGVVYRLIMEYDKALEYDEKALKILIKTHGENHSDIETLYNNIGKIYSALDDYAKALDYYNKALGIQKIIFTDCHPDTADVLSNIGAVYYKQGDSVKALEYFNKALAIYNKIYPENHPDIKTVQDYIDELQK